MRMVCMVIIIIVDQMIEPKTRCGRPHGHSLVHDHLMNMCRIKTTICKKCGDMKAKGVEFCDPSDDPLMCVKVVLNLTEYATLDKDLRMYLNVGKLVFTDFDIINCENECKSPNRITPREMDDKIAAYLTRN